MTPDSVRQACDRCKWFDSLVKRACIGTKQIPNLRAYIEQLEQEVKDRADCEKSLTNWNTQLSAELARYKTALEKIAEYEMPKMIIKPWEVTKENVAELSMVIQDMAGIAKQALAGQKEII